MQPKQNLLCDLEKLIEYSDSAVNTVSFNPCVRPFLLSVYTEDPTSTPKIMTFLPTLLSGKENSERDWNLIP